MHCNPGLIQDVTWRSSTALQTQMSKSDGPDIRQNPACSLAQNLCHILLNRVTWTNSGGTGPTDPTRAFNQGVVLDGAEFCWSTCTTEHFSANIMIME